jgi:hypothetical protein
VVPAERDVWGPDTAAAVEYARRVERKMLARLLARSERRKVFGRK